MPIFLTLCGFLSLIACALSLFASEGPTTAIDLTLAGIGWLAALTSFAGAGICRRLEDLKPKAKTDDAQETAESTPTA